jgi:hypothetical protein
MPRYLDIEMPEDFILECLTHTGEWIDWGRYQADAFTRCEDGAYLCLPEAGSPMWLRCLRQEGSVVYVVDGHGEPYTYRLVPYPSDRYRPPT